MAAPTELSARRIEEIDTVLRLCQAGIPLTLLLDLAMPLHSDDVYTTESGTADWLVARVA